MSVTKRQFDLLQAMGITVWQRRNLPAHVSQPALANVEKIKASTISSVIEKEQATITSDMSNHTSSTADVINIDLEQLLSQQLFSDVIQCLGVNRVDLSIQNNQVDLGLINWQFSQSEHIEFNHNCLKTPDLNTIANSVELKKTLWQSIGPLSSS